MPPVALGEETILFERCFGSDTDQWLDAEPEEGYCSVNWTSDVHLPVRKPQVPAGVQS